MLIKVGYKPKEISVFMICDWKIPYKICYDKLNLLKIWGVKVNDCWFDNTKSPHFQLNYWTLEECKDFRGKCRSHDNLINFEIDLRYKKERNIEKIY